MLLSKTMTCKREQEWGGSRPHLKQRRIEEESTRVEIEIAQCSRNFIENKHYRHIRFLLPTTVQLQRWQLAEDPDRRTSTTLCYWRTAYAQSEAQCTDWLNTADLHDKEKQ